MTAGTVSDVLPCRPEWAMADLTPARVGRRAARRLVPLSIVSSCHAGHAVAGLGAAAAYLGALLHHLVAIRDGAATLLTCAARLGAQ